ncbi:HlyD family type I secretion periplasmic adaptor subunit [Chromatiaceae bacterium AAb-1]|nr:HlyD family type I secretion periplasmic adaptor subunit [Chromatiaceae bacterium AAb-1]
MPADTTPPKTVEQRRFEKLAKLTVIPPKTNLLERLFGRWLTPPQHNDWLVDAEWARIQQQPLKARMLLHTIAITLLLLLLWAAFAPLDEVARGDGKVIPSQQLQVIQSLDGGIVEAIYIREGQIVEAGDLLLRIDPTRFVANLRESRAQYLALSAEVARLRALINRTEPVFAAELQQQAPDTIAHELQLYHTSQEELTEQQSAFRHQLEQRQQDLHEAQAARRQYTATLALSSRELDVTRPLLRSGAVSDIDIIRLEREVANLSGELKKTEASIARAEAAIAEARNKLRESELTMLNRWQNQLSESRSRLEALTEAEAGLADKVRQTEIRAPVRGTIQRLHVNTLGGVITPGRDVLEIIPLDDQLIIEARIQPRDIAFIRPGQPAMIKLTAYDFAIYGGLAAEVQHISADTITDERDNTYYLVRLKTHASDVSGKLLIIPGMTTQVDIITGKKTVLGYLLKPILRATSQAMTER